MHTKRPNLQPGDLIYLSEDNILSLQWPIGRIQEVYSGNDNFVRVAKVKTAAHKSITRLAIKVQKMPISE